MVQSTDTGQIRSHPLHSAATAILQSDRTFVTQDTGACSAVVVL